MDPKVVGFAAPLDVLAPSVTTLYERHAPRIFAFARRLGARPSDAEEIVQEAFSRLIRALETGSVMKPEVWLYRTAHNLTMDRHRAAAGVRFVDISDPAGDIGVDEPSSDPDLWAAVERLSPRQRAVIYLRFRADFDFATIGRVLSISPVTARVIAFRALRRLRTEVER